MYLLIRFICNSDKIAEIVCFFFQLKYFCKMLLFANSCKLGPIHPSLFPSKFALKHRHTHFVALSLLHTLSNFLSLSVTLSFTPSLPFSLSLSYSLTHSLSLSLKHTHIFSYTYAHAPFWHWILGRSFFVARKNVTPKF